MIGSLVVVLAVFGPVLGALTVAAARPADLGPGRVVAVWCGMGFLASVVLLVMSGDRGDGLVDSSNLLGLQVDRVSASLLAAVTATGTVVASFARRNLDLDPAAPRFFALLGTLVTGCALVVVPGGWVALALGWVVSTWALVGLIAHSGSATQARVAQRHTARALIVGDLCVLLAISVIVSVGGWDISRSVTEVAGELGSTNVLGVGSDTLVAILLVIAGASRSAIVPFHRWLVTTLAAPTPVSALVHAGFVAGAGLLLIRFHALVLESFVAVHVAYALATVTVVLAVGAGSTRVDVKGKLAWSTVAQMGFMVVQVTVGALSSAVLHIIGHGMYKASLFLGAGDAISARLRWTRRATPLPVPSAPVRLLSVALIATLALGIGMGILPPKLPAAGIELIAVFAWLTVAHGTWGWLARGTMRWTAAVAVALAGSIVSVSLYLGGVRLVENFLSPTLGDLEAGAFVSAVTLTVTIAVIAAAMGVAALVGRSGGTQERTRIDFAFERTAHPGVSGAQTRLLSHRVGTPTGSAAQGPAPATVASGVSDSRTLSSVTVNRSQIRADVARASAIIAPAWPLTSFVAVNPLGGLEKLGFEGATAVARRTLRARTHLSLGEFRADHARGLTILDDVQWAIESHFVELCSLPPVTLQGGEIGVSEVILLDMLYGPESQGHDVPLTALERSVGTAHPFSALIDNTVSHSAAQWVARTDASEPGTAPFHDRWRADALRVSGLRRQVGPAGRAWLEGLSTDPADTIAAADAVTGVHRSARIDEMRGHLARVQGWAGYAKWRANWAEPNEHRAWLQPIDIVAARAALEAACVLGMGLTARSTVLPEAGDSLLAARVEAVGLALRSRGVIDDDRDNDAIHAILARIEPMARNSTWLRAQERGVERRLLSKLDRPLVERQKAQPAAQLAFCIDVRSEGLRRHLESMGAYDTLGFAGFFGVAMAVRRLQWDHAESRCPVLVAPSVNALERPLDTPDAQAAAHRMISRDRAAAGVSGAHSFTKTGVGAPFVMAEAAGWVAGPLAAARTLLPPRARQFSPPPTSMRLDDSALTGIGLEQRIFAAETVLKTMGLTEVFAPLVVLCGHESSNINNPHATALDCGACAGASGQDNARAVASLLNDPAVRDGLRGRGLDIPERTHFAAGLHDTVSDKVDILDAHQLPTHLEPVQARLVKDLEEAARRQSGDRAVQLPGRRAAVQTRGGDWAQIRPEWGLAGNDSFIIGPRATTAGLDLEGRSFLHNYDAARDPDGKVLETIMTAPLVVAHWISSQYYFSTVDAEVFGAGDKLMHNVVADNGVMTGEYGDLRVGLPLQSTHCGTRRQHQPVRLLAVIEAPLERIERIIGDNPILSTLIGGEWIRVAGRSHPHEPWSIRTPAGTWSAEPRLTDPTHNQEKS